jgi:hypothetical protein
MAIRVAMLTGAPDNHAFNHTLKKDMIRINTTSRKIPATTRTICGKVMARGICIVLIVDRVKKSAVC